jgi:hypothetical protein
MKYLVQPLGVIVAAALGLAIGFTGSGLEAERRMDSAQLRAETTVKSDDSRKHDSFASRELNVAHSPDDSPLATQLARDLALSSRVARWLYWLEAIEKASLSDFPCLARLANGDTTATRLVASRWVQLDLPHLFSTLSDARDRRALPVDELAGALFLEWARRDPDAAVAALQGTNSLGIRETWRFNVAGYLVEKDPERGLRALSQWGIDNFAPLMGGVAKWAAADPRHATEVVLAHPAGYTSQLAIDTIGKKWAQVDPVAAMEFASAWPGQLATALASTVLKSWAGTNINQAADWLARSDAVTRHRLSPAFVEAWAKTDPNSALAWCESNLTGSSLAQTLGSIVSDVAQKDLPSAAEFVTSMKPSSARAEAAAAVAKHWFPTWRSGKPVPVAAITWLAALDAKSTRRVIEQVQWKWSNGDVKSMAEFLATVASDRVPLSADYNAARALVRQNPPEAFAWANRLPAERALAAAREAFTEWRHSQPELAVKWLSDLPPTDPRRKLFLQL